MRGYMHCPNIDNIEQVSASMIWEAERKLNIVCYHNGRSYSQKVIANSYKTGLFRGRAAIAEKNFDAAMEGSYSVEVVG